MNFLKMLERFKYNAQSHIGLYQAPAGNLGVALASVVEAHGPNIFSQPQELLAAMEEAGTSAGDAFRICVMTQVTGFRELMRRDPRTAQLDLDRYIHNALQETGFNMDAVLHLTGSIAGAVGITMNYAGPQGETRRMTSSTVASLATTLYRDQLASFRDAFEKVLFKKSPLLLDFSILEPLVNIGIPKAQYYLGYCLLNGIQLERNEQNGVTLLRLAAEAGDGQAAAVLGDYYFEKGGSSGWSKAYEYYTGHGAIALNAQQRENMTTILNQRNYNRKTLWLSLSLFILSLLTVILAPGSTVYGTAALVGWISVVLEAGMMALGFLHHRARPYNTLQHLPVGIGCAWFVYMTLRLIF